MMGVDGDSSNPVPTSNNTVSREEYKFSLLINRLRTVFKELLVKPMWMQFCLKYPAFATNNVLRSALGLSYVEENLFVLAKERAIIADGAALVQNLSGINGADGRPVFSMRFLVKYLGLSDDDWKLNEKYRAEDEAEMKKKQEEMSAGMGGMTGGMGMGPEMGGMPDGMGMGPEMGGMSGGMGIGPEMGGGADMAGAGMEGEGGAEMTPPAE